MHLTVVVLLHRDTLEDDPVNAVTTYVFKGRLSRAEALIKVAAATEAYGDPFSEDDLVLFHDIAVRHHFLPES